MTDGSGSTPPAPAPAGGLGWIFAPLGVIAIFMDEYKNDMFIRSHVIQAAGVYVVQFILWFIGLGWIVFIYQIVMALKANKGEMVEVPVVYGIVKNMIESK
jgi:uncharacterized membrane protein